MTEAFGVKWNITLGDDSDAAVVSDKSLMDARVSDQEPNKATNYLFLNETTETPDGLPYQDFVEEYLSKIPGLKMSLFKEIHERGGPVDFLGINEDGIVFLVEVKRFKDDRSRYDVIFQSLKYQLSPLSLKLFLEAEKDTILKKIPQTAYDAALSNIEKQFINPLVVVDKARPSLIATAYSIVIRSIRSEARVLELYPMKIENNMYLCYRKYFSTERWVGNGCDDSRNSTPMVPLSEKIRDLDGKTKQLVEEIIAELKVSSKVAEKNHCFPVVPSCAYVKWGKTGLFAPGMGNQLPPSDVASCKIVLLRFADPQKGGKEEAAEAARIGFIEASSENGSEVHYCFELHSGVTPEKLQEVIRFLKKQADRVSEAKKQKKNRGL